MKSRTGQLSAPVRLLIQPATHPMLEPRPPYRWSSRTWGACLTSPSTSLSLLLRTHLWSLGISHKSAISRTPAERTQRANGSPWLLGLIRLSTGLEQTQERLYLIPISGHAIHQSFIGQAASLRSIQTAILGRTRRLRYSCWRPARAWTSGNPTSRHLAN